jgi:serine/threonine-protein kinase
MADHRSMNPKKFFGELKRRNVYKVAVAYILAGWALAQGIAQVFPVFDIPNWVVRVIVLLIVIGFPIALILAWVFELTPEGIKRAEDVDINKSTTRKTGRKLIWVTGVVAILAAALFVSGRLNLFHSKPSTTTVAANDKSIAVLPFVDLSQGKDQEYFCDGISEEILDALAKVEGLRVVARTSSFSFKGKNADVGEIAQKLNVQNVLEGSLRREGNRIRITAQLVSAASGFHLWSETYERELQGVFAVQDEITRAIVDALKIKLAVAPVAQPQRNTEAYDLYLQGLYLSNKSDEESLRKSLDLFQRARDKDPNFGRAWTGTAKAWLWLADAYVKPLEAYPKVEEAASKALALDERDAEARCYLGEAKRVLHWDLAGEEMELQRALRIDPNSAPATFTLGLLRASQSRLGEAVIAIEKAQELDPLSPIVSSFASLIYLGANQLDNAIAAGQRTVQLDPTYVYYESGIAGAYREKGEFDKAVAIGKRAQQISGVPNAGLAITYARMGKVTEAQAILTQMIDLARTRYFAADSIAEIYVALGQTDEAFRWLDRAVNEHSAPVEGIAFRPEFRSLHSDPRFAAILKRIGLDPAKILVGEKKP